MKMKSNRPALILFLAFATLIGLLGIPTETDSEEINVELDITYEDPNESEKIDAAIEWNYIQDCTITAYCACEKCCGEWADGITATGTKVQSGVTVAVDPEVIPLGAWVVIGDEWYHAEDTGAFRGNHVDVFMENHDEALEFGKQHVDVRWIFYE